MPQPAPLNDDDRENLTAYVDGELDDRTTQTIEAKLNLDPQARKEAEALRKAWELLDYLPRPQASAEFANRTVERITISQAAVSSNVRLWQIGLWGAVWLAALLLAGGIGFAVGRLLGER